MTRLDLNEIAGWYAAFGDPVVEIDCGDRCAPYNESRTPFCCDTRHAVPTAYREEWQYLRANTHLWHLWQASEPGETKRLQDQTPENQVLIECLGARLCQRGFRSFTCRAFPFFPYLTRQGDFIGLTYYWQYEDRCWVISNLDKVKAGYVGQFVAFYDALFGHVPQERENFRYHSTIMRRVFGKWRRAIPLLHRNGGCYKVTPRNGRMRKTQVGTLPAFGPYQIANDLPFADELGET